MKPYCLEDKILITKEFLEDLENKSWQEIEVLQNQIANIEASPKNTEAIQLLKNLLTSYYVFIGGLENLSMNSTKPIETGLNREGKDKEDLIGTPELIDNNDHCAVADNALDTQADTEIPIFEPFEYFVDFGDPIGEPLVDEDLYGKN